MKTARRDDCENYDEAVANIQPRHVDLRSFREACWSLLDRLEEVGPSLDAEVEQRRQSLMRSVNGILEESRCGQTMIIPF